MQYLLKILQLELDKVILHIIIGENLNDVDKCLAEKCIFNQLNYCYLKLIMVKFKNGKLRDLTY